MNLDHDFFQVSKLSEDQKMEHFFPQILVKTCAQIHTTVKLLEGMQMKTILKLLGGIYSNYWGDVTLFPPWVSAPQLKLSLAPMPLVIPFAIKYNPYMQLV